MGVSHLCSVKHNRPPKDTCSSCDADCAKKMSNLLNKLKMIFKTILRSTVL